MKKIVIVLGFLLLSCNDESNLGGDYYYLTDYEARDVGYEYGSIVYKSTSIDNFKDILVYSDIKKCVSNNEFVLISQVPNKPLMIRRIKKSLEFWNSYFLKNKKNINVDLVHGETSLENINKLFLKKSSQSIDMAVDSIFRNEIFYKKMFQDKRNYYIIQKDNDSIFGPLTLKEFEKIRIKKSITLDIN